MTNEKWCPFTKYAPNACIYAIFPDQYRPYIHIFTETHIIRSTLTRSRWHLTLSEDAADEEDGDFFFELEPAGSSPFLPLPNPLPDALNGILLIGGDEVHLDQLSRARPPPVLLVCAVWVNTQAMMDMSR